MFLRLPERGTENSDFFQTGSSDFFQTGFKGLREIEDGEDNSRVEIFTWNPLA